MICPTCPDDKPVGDFVLFRAFDLGNGIGHYFCPYCKREYSSNRIIISGAVFSAARFVGGPYAGRRDIVSTFHDEKNFMCKYEGLTHLLSTGGAGGMRTDYYAINPDATIGIGAGCEYEELE